MNTRDIRKEAKQLFKNNRFNVMIGFYIIMCISMLFQFLNSGFLVLFGQILLVTLPHGYVYLSLKLIQDRNLDHMSYKDILVGILHLAKYLPSYITRMIIIYLPTIAFLSIPFLATTAGKPSTIYDVVDQVIYFIYQKGINATYLSTILNKISLWTIPFVFLATLVFIILTVNFLFVPYIVEDYDYSWYEALKKSTQLMKGNFKDLLSLIISFIPNVIYYNLLTALLAYLVAILGSYSYYCYLFILMILEIYLFFGEFHISLALFYLRIRNENKTDELIKIQNPDE